MTETEQGTASRREARAVELMVEMCNALSGYAYAIDALLDPATTEGRGPAMREAVYACAKEHRDALAADAEHEQRLRSRIESLLNTAAKSRVAV